MRRLRDLSIGRKLLGASLVAALAALVAAAAAFVAYDLHTFRRLLVQRIETDTRIVAFNTVSAVVFDDAEAARATLAALQAEPEVESAGVYTPEGRLFAAYAREGASAPRAPLQAAAGHRFTSRHLLVAHPIDFEDRRIGMVVIQADLSEIRERAWHYAGIVLVVLGGSLVAATVVSRRLQGAIARPILDLSETASRVSRESDYSIRARAHGADELGALVESFNGMLAHIQAQDAALREARDTLERRVAERTRQLETRSQELFAANKELEAFSYSVSHDLRAPLRAIDGFSKALLAQYKGRALDAQGDHYLGRVRAATQRMSQLIDDLLHLARVTRAGLERREVDLTRVARGIAEELERQQPERRLEIAIADGLSAFADPHLVGIVLQNLLGNAWKFTSRNPDGRIEVGAQGEDGTRVLFVRDNGAGFDMTYADKLFGVFQRLHTDAEFEGTGIGLATVQRIMHRHGGRIWAEAAVGRGATFYFTFQGDHDRQDDPAR
jgi:signal transduction histidine kinase